MTLSEKRAINRQLFREFQELRKRRDGLAKNIQLLNKTFNLNYSLGQIIDLYMLHKISAGEEKRYFYEREWDEFCRKYFLLRLLFSERHPNNGLAINKEREDLLIEQEKRKLSNTIDILIENNLTE